MKFKLLALHLFNSWYVWSASHVGEWRCVCAKCARATERASVRESNLFVLFAASGRVNHTIRTNQQRTRERTNKRTNERTSEQRTNARTYERTNERTNEKVKVSQLLFIWTKIHNSFFFLTFWSSFPCNFCVSNHHSFQVYKQCNIFFVFTGLQTGLYFFSKEKKKKIITLFVKWNIMSLFCGI